MEKSLDYSKYRNGVLIPLLIGIVLFLVLYFYSRLTTPGQEIFLSKSLYSLAVIVLSSFLVSLSLFFFSIYRFYFSQSHAEKDPKSFLYQIQHPLRTKKYKLIFFASTLAYFIFFGFLSNIFIYFINEHTIFSIIPVPAPNHNSTEELDRLSNASNTHNQTPQQHQQEQSHSDHQTPVKAAQIQDSFDSISTKSYPYLQLVICCNSIGYVPMLIMKLTEHFSILIIPLNLLIATILSVLVGLNTTLNIFILTRQKSIKLSKRNFFGAVGISTGLFVGCPTCTGSLFYSLVGISSLVLFTSLNFYQILFVVISIPMLFASLLLMMKMLQKSFVDICKV
ncbi:hypothetical protein [Candidatus Nitrosocosmicus hydrocola]|uniref:hypothetical protein n=1 Tax=Candidatus Nitrosocosmicus hydrocola TaxID=1826872 RepID=UPI0011E5BF9F|nr:hypothetical protein [Candidatus Nitrosocosmicus hydrocola]